MKIEEITDKDLLENYFYLACHFNEGLDDFKLDKLFALEDEILRRMKKSMKYKQNMLDLLQEIKDEVLALEAPEGDIDRISGLIDKTKDYFDDYAFEITDKIQDIKSLACEIERMTED